VQRLSVLVAPIVLALVFVACAFFMPRGDRFRHFWEKWLVVSVPMEHADALIVLGGEPLARPQEAARLYGEGIAPLVFVSGIGDHGENRRILLRNGVPDTAIHIEPGSFSTFTNALFLRPILQAAHVRTALIVTSPFHTRRALATFRRVMPGIRFGVTDASIGWWSRPEGQGDVNRFAALEFVKTAEYWLCYGIMPFGYPLESSAVERIRTAGLKRCTNTSPNSLQPSA
jgi:uncharacterized SAM-binding protein YcdF (DUF218 family)